MTAKEIIARMFAMYVSNKSYKWQNDPIGTQTKTLKKLISKSKKTVFGKSHNFKMIKNYEEYKKNVPIRDYEGLKIYIDQIKRGESNVLWPGKPHYLCKTSGTTSGVKFIPLTKESLPNHINSARNALLNYICKKGNADFVNGKFIFIQGSPELDIENGILYGRLSGIVAHHVPKYLQSNRLPSFLTNSIEDWEKKIDTIVNETINEDMTLIGGIPSWLQMYFEKLMEKSGGKSISDIFPNLKLLIVGGVNFEPYANSFYNLIGKKIDYLEVYPASEGFFAYQDNWKDKGLLLLLNEGIFYEFIKADEVFKKDPQRISLEDVQIDVNYAIIINSNAGLWGYLIGDTIRFTSLTPHRIVVTGRIKHFISAFGEHVIAEEIESSLFELSKTEKIEITEFTVAPEVNPKNNQLPHHEWYIEFNKSPDNLISFASKLDKILQSKNPYYKDLIKGNILQTLKIVLIKQDGFKNYMRINSRLGGQNKIVHLCNDRNIVCELSNYAIK